MLCFGAAFGVPGPAHLPPGQVMTGALDELQAGIGQGAGDPAGGIDGNQGVPGVGEQEDRHLDRGDGVMLRPCAAMPVP
jgi:hypothetical protein